MTEQAEKPNYKKTILKPNTSFSMKANLVQREPEFQKRWEKLGLYDRMRAADHPHGSFVFHDGPPYANGDIHIGHLLNKVLKDMVVRSRLMAGFDVNFVPGWDCHGLPIEHKVMKALGDKARDMEPIQVRRKCKSYAEKYVKLQAGQMKRLGTVGDYDHPYITMDRQFEAGVIEVFARLVEKGLVYRALKPVHWSIANQTALADAELEYKDRQDTSVYVLFEVTDLAACGFADKVAGPIHLMIWTTTPWTLPANLAVAVSERAEYSLFEYTRNGRTRHIIMAEDLHKQVFEKEGLETSAGHRRLATCKGSELVGMTYRHPFIDRVSPVVAADYVTLDDGTGMVHTAPGHGVEDYQTGLRVGLDIYCPVLPDGTFDATAPQWLQGKSIWDGNQRVVDRLRESGHLFHAHQFTHSYPHDWRSKTPVIFRATEQWFISVDSSIGQRLWIPDDASRSDFPPDDGESLRERALAIIKETNFIPEWGRNRMRGMLDSRPDWCISRQRAWGLPIPAFINARTGEALLTAASVRAVAEVFREKGSDAWFFMSPAELLAKYDPSADPDAPDWLKPDPSLIADDASFVAASDIFDVWFESGSSWFACMKQRGLARETGPHTDLYLEGSDQHRGWFQLSLLPALGATGRPPFGTVLTHGFMVDAKGEKMSKSGGNAINVEDLMKENGADVCRWWVAGLNYANDVKVDWEFFRLAGEEYRKVRNTLRFLLGNLGDFDINANRRELTEADASSIDAWVIGELHKLIDTVSGAYERYSFRVASEAVYNFCNDTLSAVYLAAVKDRMYCDAPDSDRRRRSQMAMYVVARELIKLVAPILVHTADEAWLALHGLDTKSDDTVHTQNFDRPESGPALAEGWQAAMVMRDRALKTLEDARNNQGIENPLDAGLSIAVESEKYAAVKPLEAEMADLCGVSRFAFVENGNATVHVEDLSDEPRCERSWKRDGTVRLRSDGGMLSDRDAATLGLD